MVEDPIMGREADAVFHALPDPAFRVDGSGTITGINAAAAAEPGADTRRLVGLRIQDTRLAQNGAEFEQALARVREQGAAVTIECRSEQGGRECHQEVRLAPLGAEERLVLVRLITERKLAENALRETAAQFRVVTDNITDALWIRTPDMREVRYVSPAFERIWGRPASYLHGNPHEWVQFIVAEDREHVVRTFAGLTGDTRTVDVEYRILRPDGQQRWIRARAFQVRDAQDALICHTGIVTDITERKLAQASLGEAHKQLLEASRRAGMAEIATNVLHNVGNILNSVTVSAGVVRDTLRTSRAQGLQRAVEMMDANAADLAGFLVRDEKGKMLPGYLAGISRALLHERQEMIEELDQLTRSIDHIREVVNTQQSYAGKAGVIAPARISQLVEDALRINGDALKRDRVAVLREFGSVPRAHLDRTKVLQILVNLIGNAREALHAVPPEARRITVGAALQGERLRVFVRDEGEGIGEATLTRIFAHGFTTRKHGHGFGLHSCVQAAAEMRGTLAVHSDGPGLGATFTLDLPFEPEREAP